jgi:hypothetical protein
MRKCWIIGSALLILVVVSLGAFVPRCNQTISQIQNELATLEYDREMRFMNIQWFLLQDLREGQIVIDMYFQKLLKEENAFQSAEARREKQIEKSLSKLHSALTGEIASAELKAKWDKMDTQQLHNEVKRLVEKQDFNKLYDNIKNKKTELGKAEGCRIFVLVCTTMLQVIGLIMISVSQYFREYAKQESPKKKLRRK